MLLAVFAPVAFMGGIIGRFFFQFGVTVSAAVLISLFVSFTLDPMLSSRFSKAHGQGAVDRFAIIKRPFELVFRIYGQAGNFPEIATWAVAAVCAAWTAAGLGTVAWRYRSMVIAR